jgi:cell wall-associated NlpC family hydrolase
MSKKLSVINFIFITIVLVSCADIKQKTYPTLSEDTISISILSGDTVIENKLPEIATPDSIVAFARTLIGTPYLYASTDPKKGFDCSGFITYVFNHFNIVIPRSSVDFTNYGEDVTIEDAKQGDLILFTGTDSAIRIVGHMGIVENVREGKLHFIHSTSGKGKGVVITPFEKYYQSRFVKVIRVFPDAIFQ